MDRRPPAVVIRSALAALGRPRGDRRHGGRLRLGRVLTVVVCLLAGWMIMVSAVNARGTDLRPGRNTDLVSLVQAQSRRNTDLAAQVTQLRREVDASTTDAQVDPTTTRQLSVANREAGFAAVVGPALTVTLDDAPASVIADGVDQDLLVVHQQDIQAVVNVLWAGGAEAMTIQGQRVVSTTGVKCVGNTVVLHGIPYAPPYVISAIGDQQRLRSALADSATIQIYQQYVEAYRLGYKVRSQSRVRFPAHEGALELSSARIYQAQTPGAQTPASSKPSSGGPTPR